MLNYFGLSILVYSQYFLSSLFSSLFCNLALFQTYSELRVYQNPFAYTSPDPTWDYIGYVAVILLLEWPVKKCKCNQHNSYLGKTNVTLM
uniref:Putative ovule protein n=1 Tax=Solanum chacoense TaxID=4108 RepID=A0A0V0GUL5_SOLCH